MKVFITGIDTDIGKTFISAILVDALKADYFKPIQCGDLENSDTLKISEWTEAKVHPESYRFKAAQSPHLAARLENKKINLKDIKLPDTSKNLIIEGAGGLLVPLNDNEYIIDIPKYFNLPVILVCNSYLGSLNHTLLSIEALKERGIEILGLIFNGKSNPESEDFLVKKSGLKILLHVGLEKHINHQVISKYSQRLAKWI